MKYGVIIKSINKDIIPKEIQQDIGKRISNIDFKQLNQDLKDYGVSIVSIASLVHCEKMKLILLDYLPKPINVIILKETSFVDIPNIMFEKNKYELFVSDNKLDYKQFTELIKKVIGCSQEAATTIYNNTIFNEYTSVGEFPLEIAELKMQQLDKINNSMNQFIAFKLKKVK